MRDGVAQVLVNLPTEAGPPDDLPDLPALTAWICSVVPEILPGIMSRLATATGAPVRVVGRHTPLPLKHAYETPETLGMDRLVAALAAWREFPAGALVLDAGSAVTLDLVDSRGVFQGGAIAPGPEALQAALRGIAPVLECGEVRADAPWPGRSTRASCQVGLAATMRGQIRELLRAGRSVAGADLPLVLTGGQAAQVAALLPEEPFRIRPDLVLAGIAHVAAGTLEDGTA